MRTTTIRAEGSTCYMTSSCPSDKQTTVAIFAAEKLMILNSVKLTNSDTAETTYSREPVITVYPSVW